jgi:hypothetical protein
MSEEQQILPVVDLSSASPLHRRPNPNHFLKNMKPVPVDVGLEFHEKLITKVDKSLKATKFRLHQTELLLNLEPPPDEANHHVDWIATIDDMLSSNHRLHFPNFSSLQKQHEFNQLVKKQSKTHERAQSRQEWNRRAALILAKETQNIQKKVLAGKCTFGSSAKGVPLKTISDYSGKHCLTSCHLLLMVFLGCNTFDKESRTLVRKEGRIQPEDREHNLPDWFCPQYYDSNKYDPKKKHDNSYQIPFKSPERYPQFSEELINREHVKRRRKELAALRNDETKQSLSTSNLLMSSKDQTLPRPATTANNNNNGFSNKRVSMISDLDEDEYDSESMVDSVDELEGEGTEEGSSGQSSLNKMNRRLQKLRKSILMENSSTNGDSTASTASYSIDFSESSIGKLLDKYDTAVTRKASEQLMRRRSRSPTQQATRLSMLPLPDQGHLKKLQKKQQLQEQYEQRKMSQSSSISVPPRNSIYHRPSTVLSPIEAHHSYALKILDGSDPTKQKGWKPKDYTLEALKYQKPIEFSTFFIEDTFDDPAALLPVTSPAGIANNNPSVATTQAPSTVSHHNSHHSHNSTSSGSTTVLKYSSDVFRLKPGAHYKSSDVLLREMDEKIKLRTQAEVQAQTVQKQQRRMTTPGTAPTAGNQSLGNTVNHHQHSSTANAGNEGVTEDLQGGVGEGGESPKRQHSALTSPTLGIGENNLSFESLSLETKSQIQDYSFHLSKNNSNKAMTLIEDDTMTAPMTKHLTLSTEELLYSPSSIKKRLLRPQLGSPSMDNNSEQPSESNFTQFLNKWYDENDIIRYKYSKKQDYSLYSGPRLPSSDGTTIHESSMDKSLKGLLLQENPYLTKEKQEELIKNNKLRDIGDVEV